GSLYYFYGSAHPRHLHSFPTRRSSDLAMLELCKKRTAGLEDFEYMIGHTGIKQGEDLRRACKKAFGQEPLTIFELGGVVSANTRSEEHTSELQSRFDLVCRLLLEKKNE